MVEWQLPKLQVAGSSPVSRSNSRKWHVFCNNLHLMKVRECNRLLEPTLLNDTELVEILIGSGPPNFSSQQSAQWLLREFGGLRGLLGRSPYELARIPGIGVAKASRLIVATEIGRRLLAEPTPGVHVGTPQGVYKATRDLVPLQHELCLILTVDSKNRLKRRYTLAQGDQLSCRIEPRLVFSLLLKEGEYRYILVHNHPSGDPTPSAQDLALTKRLLFGGYMIGVGMVDHVVVGKDSYYSIRSHHPTLGDWDVLPP